MKDSYASFLFFIVFYFVVHSHLCSWTLKNRLCYWFRLKDRYSCFFSRIVFCFNFTGLGFNFLAVVMFDDEFQTKENIIDIVTKFTFHWVKAYQQFDNFTNLNGTYFCICLFISVYLMVKHLFLLFSLLEKDTERKILLLLVWWYLAKIQSKWRFGDEMPRNRKSYFVWDSDRTERFDSKSNFQFSRPYTYSGVD